MSAIDAAAVRAAHFDYPDITAIVALNVFTNCFNLVAETVIDFPDIAPA